MYDLSLCIGFWYPPRQCGPNSDVGSSLNPIGSDELSCGNTLHINLVSFESSSLVNKFSDQDAYEKSLSASIILSFGFGRPKLHNHDV